MPKLKQPVLLQRRAFEYYVTLIVSHCDRLSVAGELTLLKESIAVIKKHARESLPDVLFVDVCRKFLYQFYEIRVQHSKDRPDSHHAAALEILMDLEISGLRCEGDILRYLDPRDAHRLLGLKILDLSRFWDKRPEFFENLRLENLTTLLFPGKCTDDDLEIIGSSCPKLQVLNVKESKFVTDRGLRAIRPCSELRVINLHYCCVTDSGINEMLSVHEKLEEFNIGGYYTFGEKSFDVLTRDKSLVCPSIKRFSIKSDPVTDAHLNAVVTLFPNLTHLRICCKLEGDIRLIKSLDKLTELNLSYGYTDVKMDHFKDLLIHIGGNLSLLGIHYCFPPLGVTQNDLNFIFKHCGNIESFEFDFKPISKGDKLVVPPFRKLKTLRCVAMDHFNEFRILLDFDKMLELEKLVVQGFVDIFNTIESIVLDHDKFPKLKDVRTFYNMDDQVRKIKQIAKNNNLDFEFLFSQ